ncbi:hypothetical protein LINGRAHAP2_LOCUS13480 [Linum grandiflorum]
MTVSYSNHFDQLVTLGLVAGMRDGVSMGMGKWRALYHPWLQEQKYTARSQKFDNEKEDDGHLDTYGRRRRRRLFPKSKVVIGMLFGFGVFKDGFHKVKDTVHYSHPVDFRSRPFLRGGGY